MSYAEDTDPRFAEKTDTPRETARGGLMGRAKARPRIAFSGEEFGFGYQATGRFLAEARRRGTVPDGGLSGVSAAEEREVDAASKNGRFDYSAEITQPLRTKEQALMAVKQGTADFAVVPFYNPYSGYDFESLRALGSLLTLLGVQQVEATDDLCLAVHESQLYDLIQSSHPGSGFSALQRRFRKSWGGVDSGSGNAPGAAYDAEMPRAGLPIDMADQKLIRDRIDLVFAGPEAARRCKSKLDGLRAIGVDVQELAEMIEPHRELARLARSTANTARQTNTFFDPVTGETRFFSTLGAESQAGKLFGMVLPYEVAMRSSDYVIIDHKFDDAPEQKTRFLVVENNPDHTLFEDAYRTTDAKTRYWMNRLRKIADGAPESRVKGFVGDLMLLGGTLLAGVGAAKLAGWQGLAPLIEATPAAALAGDWTALWLGAALIAVGAFVKLFQTETRNGVRVMLRFRRDGTAASTGDVENFLRNYGVRHQVVRLDEDSEGDRPASIMLDIEFDPVDFRHDLISMITRRLRGSVANGAIKKSFQRWKNRGVLVLGAMPFSAPQMPKHRRRSWYGDALVAWLYDFVETQFVRLSRVLFIYALPAIALGYVAYLVWKTYLGG